MLFKSTVIDRRVDLFVIGLGDTVAALIRWAVVTRRFNILYDRLYKYGLVKEQP